MPIYLMSHPDEDGEKRERLVEASSIQMARNHVAKGLISGGIAKSSDLFRLAKADVELEKAGEEATPEPQAEPQAGEPPAVEEPPAPEKSAKGAK